MTRLRFPTGLPTLTRRIPARRLAPSPARVSPSVPRSPAVPLGASPSSTPRPPDYRETRRSPFRPRLHQLEQASRQLRLSRRPSTCRAAARSRSIRPMPGSPHTCRTVPLSPCRPGNNQPPSPQPSPWPDSVRRGAVGRVPQIGCPPSHDTRGVWLVGSRRCADSGEHPIAHRLKRDPLERADQRSGGAGPLRL